MISRNGATQNVSVELGDRSAFFEKRMKGKMRDFDNALAFSMPNQDFYIGHAADGCAHADRWGLMRKICPDSWELISERRMERAF